MTKDVQARYGIVRESTRPSTAATNTRQLVLLVHGYNSSPAATASLLAPARRAGLHCAGFAYPNDQSLGDSAKLLSRELKRLAREEPSCRVALVTHSMGGLVARACLEEDRLDPGNVDRLIMVAPPTHGSMLARYAVATDLWEHWISRKKGSPWRRARDSIIDGLGEASADLTPGSPFLASLNSRERNARVAYTLVLGSGAAISDAQINWLRERVCKTLKQVRAKESAERIGRCLAELEEIVSGKGDGVVAIRRARLAGVDDVTILDFGHLEVATETTSVAARRAQQVVLDRLLQKSNAPQTGKHAIHLTSSQAN